MTRNANLFCALRDEFPAHLDATAIEAVEDPPLYYTWRDLERSTAKIANLLSSLDLPPGSRVAVQVEKSVEALMLYLAVLRAGFVYLPLNTAYQAQEMDYFISDSQPGVVVCASARFAQLSQTAFAAGTSYVYTLDANRTGTLLQRAAHHSDQHRPVHRQPGDLAAILYTSGTTGRSKGAMLSHANLLSNARVLKEYWRWQAGDVLIHALPIFHVHGLFVATHAALLSGSKMLWLNRFDARAVVSQLPRATVFMGVPTMYVRLLQEATLTPSACRHMRLFISGSAPLLTETFERFEERSGHVILERYGMSETAMLTSNPCDTAEGPRRAGTVGRPLPGVELRVTADSGSPCPAQEIGNIEVRGPNVFLGYWKMPEKTQAEFTADGWFKTGDVGKIDESGYVTIVGRSKDLIISGGFNVYPAEVEACLNDLQGVSESAVIGVPHPDFGEAVVAVVVAPQRAAADAGQLIAELKPRIASFKVPKQVFLVDELPRNAMGKVLKAALREQHHKLFA